MSLLSYLRKHHKIVVTIVVTIVAILCRKYISYFSFISTEEENMQKTVQTFSKDQLKKYNGLGDKNMYLAVIGTIYDVTEKTEYYGIGSPYHYFVGKDGSRAFISGDFKDESEGKDHTLDMACNEIFIILDWRKTFGEKYPSVGLLIGRYYDKYGRETDYMRFFKQKVLQCKKERDRIERQGLVFPSCNISWNQNEGTRVWCTISSGGVIRSWVGVPRQLYTPGEEKPRCVCVQLARANNRLLKPYDGCPDTSEECLVRET